MGALYSVQQKFSEVTLIKEEMEESEATPTKTETLKHKRLLALDPRSPSEGINRTPIIVDQTPKLGSKRFTANNLNETPVLPTMKDPRSPTEEFARTPINPCLAAASRQQVNAGLNLEGTPVTGKSYDSESGIESAEVTPLSKQERDVDSDSPDSLLNEPVDDLNICTGGREALQNHNSGHQEPSMSKTDVDTAPLIVDSDESSESGEFPLNERNSVSFIPVKSKSEESTPKLRNVKPNSQVVINKNTGSLSLTPAVTRSPLSLVENSRSSLSQRNKMTPRGGKSGYALTSRSVDKENIFH